MNYIINNFFFLDYIFLILILLNIFFSTWKGFIQSILGLLTWIGSILITLNFYIPLSNFIASQFNKLNFFNNWDQITQLIGIVLSIPIIFIISLIILRRFRKSIGKDINRASLGIIIDKLLGAIYGALFSYIVISTILYFTFSIGSNYLFIKETIGFLIDHSFILLSINDFNYQYIYGVIPFTNNEIIIYDSP